MAAPGGLGVPYPAPGLTPLDLDGATVPQHSSGLTTRLILQYVERERGRGGVDALLEHAGLAEAEDRLRDEYSWFHFDTKNRLFESAAHVLDDPLAARRIGASALALNVGSGIKLALRAGGSTRLIYAGVVAVAAKLTRSHRWEIVELGRTHARLRARDVSGVGSHPATCEYNVGLLSCVPELFGMPPARVRHSLCALRGADHCVFDVRWLPRSTTRRTAVGWAAASLAVAGLTRRAAPHRLALASVVPVVGAGMVAWRSTLMSRRGWLSLEASVREHEEATDRLVSSLHDLVSDLHEEEVLDKVVNNARGAVGGSEFALVLSDGPSKTSAGVSPDALEALEHWVASSPKSVESPVAVADLAKEPELAPLAARRPVPLGSLCAAPLVFKDRHLGVLIALAPTPEGFLARDPALLESYAAQAAVALSQMKTFETLESQAREDSLTGLFNHREFHEASEREVERCRRYKKTMAVVLFDIDGLKAVNDRWGHAEGDRVLRGVGQTITAAGRASDVACRIGGDEFGVVLPESSAADGAAVAARAARAIEEERLGVTVSFGVAEWPGDGPTKENLLLFADRSLYRAKPHTRGEPPAEGSSDVTPGIRPGP